MPARVWPRGHLVLLGDSIFDNGAYTGGGPDVTTHLRSQLPRGWDVTLGAVDGSTTGTLPSQVAKVPSSATHIAIAIGGNDALGNRDLLSTRVQSTAETLTLFGDRVARFETSYRSAITAAVKLKKPVVVCTIYNGRLEPAEARLARVALMTFNDAILRVAFELALTVIDLRAICHEPEDYANPIEPSSQGGRKIANALAAVLGFSDGSVPLSHVYASAGR